MVIPKPGKPDYSIPKAYRPVALLNCLGKILEKLFATRLSFMSETHQLLHNNQIGGRQQRSAVDAAMALAHEVDEARHEKESVSIVLMDVRGAFDNVSKPQLIQTLTELGLPPPITSWVTHFLSNQQTALAFDGAREKLGPVQTGIPQGSPASPILFLLYIRPLFDKLHTHLPTLWTPSYIDDVAIVVRGKNCDGAYGLRAVPSGNKDST